MNNKTVSYVKGQLEAQGRLVKEQSKLIERNTSDEGKALRDRLLERQRRRYKLLTRGGTALVYWTLLKNPGCSAYELSKKTSDKGKVLPFKYEAVKAYLSRLKKKGLITQSTNSETKDSRAHLINYCNTLPLFEYFFTARCETVSAHIQDCSCPTHKINKELADDIIKLFPKEDIKQPPHNKIKDRYLFSLESEYSTHLKDGVVNNALAEAFNKNERPLSNNAKISKKDECWEIVDTNNTYIIEDKGTKSKKDTKLNIYKDSNTYSFNALEVGEDLLNNFFLELAAICNGFGLPITRRGKTEDILPEYWINFIYSLFDKTYKLYINGCEFDKTTAPPHLISEYLITEWEYNIPLETKRRKIQTLLKRLYPDLDKTNLLKISLALSGILNSLWINNNIQSTQKADIPSSDKFKKEYSKKERTDERLKPIIDEFKKGWAKEEEEEKILLAARQAKRIFVYNLIKKEGYSGFLKKLKEDATGEAYLKFLQSNASEVLDTVKQLESKGHKNYYTALVPEAAEEDKKRNENPDYKREGHLFDRLVDILQWREFPKL